MPRLTKKQKDFADHYIDTGNGVQSILSSYDTDNAKTASVMAVENLAKPSVQQYLEENASGAASRIVTLSINAENETVQLNANKDILDRAGYKAIEKSLNVNLNVSSTSDPEADKLRLEYEAKLQAKLSE